MKATKDEVEDHDDEDDDDKKEEAVVTCSSACDIATEVTHPCPCAVVAQGFLRSYW